MRVNPVNAFGERRPAPARRTRTFARGGFALVLVVGLLASAPLARAASAKVPKKLYVSQSATTDPACNAASKLQPFATIAGALACAGNGTTLSIGPGTFTGGFTVAADVTIIGAGAATVITGTEPPNLTTEITIADGTNAALEQLTVDGVAADGTTPSNLGISTGSGTLTLDAVTVRNTFTVANPPEGAVTVRSANGAANVHIVGSTLVDNFASGVYAAVSPSPVMIDVVNSTITGNQSPFGGGIDARAGTLEVVNSTIAGNSASVAGGIALFSTNPATFTNSIVAGNHAPVTTGVDCASSGTVVDGGHNVIGEIDANSGAGCHQFVDGVNGTQAGTATAPIDPHLAPLTDAGGPVATLALRCREPGHRRGQSRGVRVASRRPRRARRQAQQCIAGRVRRRRLRHRRHTDAHVVRRREGEDRTDLRDRDKEPTVRDHHRCEAHARRAATRSASAKASSPAASPSTRTSYCRVPAPAP